MLITHQIAQHIREIHFGGNWTWVNLQEQVKDLSWQEATQTFESFNTITTLVFHMNFYLNVVSFRVQNKPFSFQHEDSLATPPIHSQADWEQLLAKTWADAEQFAKIVKEFPVERLWQNIDKIHGNYYKNIHGVVEHNHYHLGQIVFIKKVLLAEAKKQ